VTVHHALGEGDPREWDVDVVKPKTGRVLRTESDDSGHHIEFQLPSTARELVFQRRAAGSDRPENVSPTVLELRSGEDAQEFDLSGEDGDERQYTTVLDENQDDADPDDANQDENQDDENQDDENQDDGDQDVHVDDPEDGQAVRELLRLSAGALNALILQVGQLQQQILMAGGLADRISRLEALPQRVRDLEALPQRVRDLEALPARLQALEQRGGQAVVVPQQPLTGDIGDLAARAEATALKIREGFRAAGERFSTTMGLDPQVVLSGTDQGLAARTARLLVVATATAADRADRYAELQQDRQKRQLLTRDGFVREVRNAGAFYASTVADVADAAREAGAVDRRSFEDLLAELRSPQLNTAIDTSQNFAA
jgi:hypothetical protein